MTSIFELDIHFHGHPTSTVPLISLKIFSIFFFSDPERFCSLNHKSEASNTPYTIVISKILKMAIKNEQLTDTLKASSKYFPV